MDVPEGRELCRVKNKAPISRGTFCLYKTLLKIIEMENRLVAAMGHWGAGCKGVAGGSVVMMYIPLEIMIAIIVTQN